MTDTFKRVKIGIRRERGAMPGIVDAYHLHDSSWAVVKIASVHSKPWSVYHVPTGLQVHAGIESMKAARDLAVTLRNAHPVIPALAALPFGTAPRPSDADAYAEAKGIYATIQEWVKRRAVFG